MTTTTDQEWTVQIEASTDGQIWQALHPAETTTGAAAEQVATDVAANQTVADGGLWRVRVWTGRDADTGTEPAAEWRSDDEPTEAVVWTLARGDNRYARAVEPDLPLPAEVLAWAEQHGYGEDDPEPYILIEPADEQGIVLNVVDTLLGELPASEVAEIRERIERQVTQRA